jgi:uncharacterized protein (DUF885 family)
VHPLIATFVDEYLAEHPTQATMAGASGFDGLTADLSAEGFARRHRWVDEWGTRLDGSELAGRDVSDDDGIDRDLVRSWLAEQVALRDWEAWRRDPDVYLTTPLRGVFGLFLHRVRPDTELVDAAVARLEAVPATVASARANLAPELASPVLVNRALAGCRAAAHYTRDLVPLEVTEPGLRARLHEAGQVAADAYDSLTAHLEALAERAHGPYAVGEARYSALLTGAELLGYGAAELRRRGREAYAELEDELRKVAVEIRGDDDWHAAADEITREHPTTETALRDAFEDWTARCRAFLAERELLSFVDGEECTVAPSPTFQRPVLAVANYFQPPALTSGLRGWFFVPFSPEGTPEPEVQQRLSKYSVHTIPTVSAHEAYPGHHWHLVTAGHAASPVRSLLTSPFGIEGWGLYSERLMDEQGFFGDPRQRLAHLKARIFRAARMILDTGLHIGDLTYEEAVRFLQTSLHMAEPVARAEVARYCARPTQAASYLTGSLEIERLRGEWLRTGRGDLRGFHDAFARSGALPVALHARALGIE